MYFLRKIYEPLYDSDRVKIHISDIMVVNKGSLKIKIHQLIYFFDKRCKTIE